MFFPLHANYDKKISSQIFHWLELSVSLKNYPKFT